MLGGIRGPKSSLAKRNSLVIIGYKVGLHFVEDDIRLTMDAKTCERMNDVHNICDLNWAYYIRRGGFKLCLLPCLVPCFYIWCCTSPLSMAR